MSDYRLKTAQPNSEAAPAPQLRRVLTRTDLVLYGLAIITPTAAYPLFGIVQETSRGHAALSYLGALVAMLFTAISYGRMAAAFPLAGSTYTYAGRSLHGYAGFLGGWSMIMDYVLVPLLSAVYVSLTAARLAPGVPFAVWAFLFAVGITLVNSRGVQVTARASNIMTAIMSASAALFVIMAIAHLVSRSQPWFDSRTLYDPQTFALHPLILGAGIAVFSYLGFDVISTLAEETKNPSRDIPAATVLVCLIQTVFCFAIVYLAASVWPATRPFGNLETAILDVSREAGGEWLFWINSLVLLVAAVASSVTCQAGAARLLYGMGRDRLLPPRIFAYLHPKYATPIRSIWLMGVLSFFGALLISFQLVVELVNFGAFIGFILVNLSVIGHFYVRQRQRSGKEIWTNLVLPALGAVVCTYVWMNLSTNAKYLGFGWMAIGILYLAVLTKGFRGEAKPLEMP